MMNDWFWFAINFVYIMCAQRNFIWMDVRSQSDFFRFASSRLAHESFVMFLLLYCTSSEILARRTSFTLVEWNN